MDRMKKFLGGESGASLVEYAMILAFIGIGFSVFIAAFGASLNSMFVGVGAEMTEKADQIPR
jgi:Flp pilus assembly pilin Flp